MTNKIKFFFNYLEKNNRCLILRDPEGQVYLKRYYILFKEKTDQFEEEKRKLPFNIFIHKIMKSDTDDLHDHPWWYFTFILKNFYVEEFIDSVKTRSRWSFRISNPRKLHRIVVDESRPPVTLFIRGPKIRDWGFVKDGKWIFFKKYLQERQNSAKIV